MKHLKRLGLMALAISAALAAFAGSASATELTSPKGITYNGTIGAESVEGIRFHGITTIGCNKSTWEAAVEQQGSSITVSGKMNKFNFTECGNATVTVTAPGTFEIHTDAENADGNGTMTSSGATITTLLHYAVLGTVHCITETNNTLIGTITGSLITEKTPETDPEPLPDPTDFMCSEEVELTNRYKITSPHYLDID